MNPPYNGVLDDEAWKEVEFTDDFVDIANDVVPRFRTRVKMRWDKKYLYVGAVVEETQAWANLTKHDSVIFQDNDFEVTRRRCRLNTSLDPVLKSSSRVSTG